MPRKSSRARSRRLGILGLLLSAALTPAGIMVGTVTAGALVGGLAFHLKRTAPTVPSTPTQSVPAQAYSPQHLVIERDGEALSLVLNEDRPAGDDGTGAFDPPGPLPGGPGRNGTTPHTAPGGMPSHASPGVPAPGGKPSLAGPAPVSPFLAGPNGAPPGVGPSPAGSPPAGAPPHAGPPRPPAGNGDTGEPPDETHDPTKREKTPPTLTHGFPPLVDPQPTNGLPEETLPGLDALPGMPIPPLAGNPLDSQTPPPGKQRAARPNAVPEPSMLGLMLLGSAAMAWAGRRRPARAA